MAETDFEKLKELIEAEHEFPCRYLFKFIVPKKSEGSADQLFLGYQVSKRPSKKGNYVSLSFEMNANSSSEIIEIYRVAKTIEGLISL